MRLTKARVACLGLLLATLAAPAQAQTTLRYKFKDGDQLNYEMVQKMAMKMNVQGMEVAMDMNQTITMSWNVLTVDKDGNAKMNQKIERVRFTMEGGPIGKVEYDSKEGKAPEGPIGQVLAPIFGALAGSEIALTMDPMGHMKDIKVPEKLVKALKDVPGAGAGFSDMFSEEGLKNMLNQGGLVLPAEPVTKGKTWNQKLEVKMPFGKMMVDNVYTYEGPVTKDGRQLEQVSLKPSVKMDADPNAQVAMKLKGQDAKGTAYFDNAAGRLVELNMTQNMDMEISAGGQNINQKVLQTVTMKLMDKAK
jgi:hypothetical protein